MRVAVLGSGPAGLFAAFAVSTAGHHLDIFSLGIKSSIYGAQYLHRGIPGLSVFTPLSERKIDYQLRGTSEQYKKKVYGDQEVPSVSPQVFTGLQLGWDLRATYDTAWSLFYPHITVQVINKHSMKDLIHTYDLVITTIPASIICAGSHEFPYRQVWAIGDAPDLDIYCPITVSPNTVVCNGLESPAWYRAANIFGYRTAEWPYDVDRDQLPPKARLIRKPVGTTCNCWRGRVLKLGRFGTWDKTELSDMAFYRTKEYLDVKQVASQRRS